MSTSRRSLVAELHEPLLAIVVVEDGHEVVRYFVNEADLDAYITDEHRQAALDAIGSFSDLDWDDFVDWYERMRQERMPTPQVEV